MAFDRRAYNYLLDTIINDPNINLVVKTTIAQNLHNWFERDCGNFDSKKWKGKWATEMGRDLFPSERDSPPDVNVFG